MSSIQTQFLNVKNSQEVGQSAVPRNTPATSRLSNHNAVALRARQDRAKERIQFADFESTPGISQTMPADDLFDQLLAEPSGKRPRTQIRSLRRSVNALKLLPKIKVGLSLDK